MPVRFIYQKASGSLGGIINGLLKQQIEVPIDQLAVSEKLD